MKASSSPLLLALVLVLALASASTVSAGQCDTNPLVCGVIACCPSFFLPTGYYCALTCLPFAEEKAAVAASIAAAEAPVVAAPAPAVVAPVVDSATAAVAVAAEGPCDAMECGVGAACCPSIFSPIGYYCAFACIGDAKMSSIAISKNPALKKSSVVAPKSAKAKAVTVASPGPCDAMECGVGAACCPSIFSPFGYYCAFACIGESKLAAAIAATPKLQLAAPAPKAAAAPVVAEAAAAVESAVSSILGVPVSAAASASSSAIVLLAAAATAAMARRIF